MGWAEMVVAIIVVITIGRVLQSRRSPRDEQADAVETLENRQLRGEVHALKERIQVLERVITDTHSSSDLDREIERLRDRT